MVTARSNSLIELFTRWQADPAIATSPTTGDSLIKALPWPNVSNFTTRHVFQLCALTQIHCRSSCISRRNYPSLPLAKQLNPTSNSSAMLEQKANFSSTSHQSTQASRLTRQTSILCPSVICSPFGMTLQLFPTKVHLLINHMDSSHNKSITLQPTQLQVQSSQDAVSKANISFIPPLPLQQFQDQHVTDFTAQSVRLSDNAKQ
ncbi:hypothetical protein TIFTF001_025354 [Ficus carica]|uniref:Uncharacterized protein n=1 Tax=Ficus carica TaxID=3494 RepID=A0AA88AYS2_FICCA|nr:hypothetical protein TIFTF001_025354 [Ficus carica]